MTITCIISCAGYAKNIPVLHTCIQSLFHAKTPKTKLIIVVTTNNTRHNIVQDNSIDFLFVSPKNAGFVGINNKAVIKTIKKRSDFFLIINDDAWVKSNFFSQLEILEKQNDQKGDVLIPYIFASDKKRVDSFGVEYFKTGYTKNASSSTIQTSLASMSCLLIRTHFLKSMIASYGFFLNPLLKWYLDDVEFSVRALARDAIFIKCDSLIAFHQITYTWGVKSYFVMYQSFRNLLWVILLTWPTQIIKKNLFRICCWQVVQAMYCTIKYSPFMYPKILIDTMRHVRISKTKRKRILHQYKDIHFFNTLFSTFEVRHPRITF